MSNCTYTLKSNKKGLKVLTLYSDDSGWATADKKLMRITDNGNGFTVKSYSWVASDPDMYYNIDYSDADLLQQGLALLIEEDMK
jgi:hypothetical protein